MMPGKTDNNLKDDTAEDYDRPLQFIDWGGTRTVLTENDLTGETKTWATVGDSLVQLSTDYFAESDVDYSGLKLKMNKLAIYKERLYVGCDDGLVVVFTDCAKCYKLKKVCDFDIKSMTIYDGVMEVSDGERDLEIPMSDIGGDSITAEEARVLMLGGAVLIDVREAEDYAVQTAENAVNIPIDSIEKGLENYSKDTVLIFGCYSGVRAAKAVKTAENMGFTSVYSIGKIENLY